MIYLEVLARRVLTAKEDNSLAKAVRDLKEYLTGQQELRRYHELTVTAAQNNFNTGDTHVGDQPLMSAAVSGNAVWVQAWVRVPVEVDEE